MDVNCDKCVATKAAKLKKQKTHEIARSVSEEEESKEGDAKSEKGKQNG